MSKTSPVFYVFHGDDVFTLRGEVRTMRARQRTDELGDLNTTSLEGKATTVSEVLSSAEMMPFMSDRRLVIVEGLFAHLGRKGAGKSAKEDLDRLVQALPGLPDTTRLVFVEFEQLKESHPALKIATSSGRGYIKECMIPRDRTQWIMNRVASYNGKIEPRAANALAVAVSDFDLYAADNECAKLVTFVGTDRAITEADVVAVTPYVPEADIFAIVDAIGRGNGKQALTLIHRMLRDPKQQPLSILGMINRQFRLLIYTREALDAGRDPREHPDLARVPIQKIIEQARRFSLQQLETIYRNLLETDYAIKSGREDDELALDLLVSNLSS